MKRVFLVIITFAISLGAFNDDNKSSNIKNNLDSEVRFFGHEYFPLSKNSTYIYDSNLGNTIAKTKPAGKGIQLDYKSGKISYKQNLYSDSTGIYLTQVENKAFFWSNKVTYSKPVLRIPFPLKIGETWSWEGYEFHDNGDKNRMMLKGKAHSIDTIETANGKYRCLKITIQIKSESGSSSTLTEWLAPEIGIVKVHAKMQGKGIASLVQKFMGLQEVNFTLAELKEK